MPKPLRVALVAVAFIAAACSSNSTPSSPSTSSASTPSASASASVSASTIPATAYAAGVCTAIDSFRTEVQKEQSGFNPNTSDLTALKKSWIAFLSGMQKSTQTLVTDINALGSPDVSNGQEAAAAIKADFEKLQKDIQDLKERSGGLSTSDPTQFISSFKGMITQFQTDMAGFGQDLESLGTGLDAAFAQVPECKGLAGGGSLSPSA
jgi:predicted small secreted protein